LHSLVSIQSSDTPVSVAEDQRGEIREGDTAGAVTVGGGKPGQGYQAVREGTIVRRLTELECERLQGFPDQWTEGQSGSARYRQLGNSVAVPCVEWIARRMVAVDGEVNA
jgi:DNA (cytosine-5)-methyltransferase 1